MDAIDTAQLPKLLVPAHVFLEPLDASIEWSTRGSMSRIAAVQQRLSHLVHGTTLTPATSEIIVESGITNALDFSERHLRRGGGESRCLNFQSVQDMRWKTGIITIGGFAFPVIPGLFEQLSNASWDHGRAVCTCCRKKVMVDRIQKRGTKVRR